MSRRAWADELDTRIDNSLFTDLLLELLSVNETITAIMITYSFSIVEISNHLEISRSRVYQLVNQIRDKANNLSLMIEKNDVQAIKSAVSKAKRQAEIEEKI